MLTLAFVLGDDLREGGDAVQNALQLIKLAGDHLPDTALNRMLVTMAREQNGLPKNIIQRPALCLPSHQDFSTPYANAGNILPNEHRPVNIVRLWATAEGSGWLRG